MDDTEAQLWEQHTEAPYQVLQQLADERSLYFDRRHFLQSFRLLEHILLEHLGDAEMTLDFLQKNVKPECGHWPEAEKTRLEGLIKAAQRAVSHPEFRMNEDVSQYHAEALACIFWTMSDHKTKGLLRLNKLLQKLNPQDNSQIIKEIAQHCQACAETYLSFEKRNHEQNNTMVEQATIALRCQSMTGGWHEVQAAYLLVARVLIATGELIGAKQAVQKGITLIESNCETPEAMVKFLAIKAHINQLTDLPVHSLNRKIMAILVANPEKKHLKNYVAKLYPGMTSSPSL